MVKLLQNARLKAMLKNLPIHLTRDYIALGVKIAVIFIAAIILFSQDLIIMFNDALLSEVTSYMIVIPFILGYILYRKRKMMKATMALHTSETSSTKHIL